MTERKLQRNRRGFTLTEVLLALAILIILLALAMIPISRHQRNIRQTELDSKAETIYLAAQNRLSQLQASGRSDEYGKDRATALNNIPWDAEQDKYTTSTLYYVTSAAKSTDTSAAGSILPREQVEAELWDANWVIEYDPGSGSVYAVFYSEKPMQYSFDAFNPLRSRDRRVQEGATVGYYGGDSVQSEDTGKLTPKMEIINKERLLLKVTCDTPRDPLHFYVTVTDAQGHSTGRMELTGSEVNVSYRTYTVTMVLDDLTEGKRFSQQRRFRQLTPGSDLTLKVEVESDSRLVDSVTGNSPPTVSLPRCGTAAPPPWSPMPGICKIWTRAPVCPPPSHGRCRSRISSSSTPAWTTAGTAAIRAGGSPPSITRTSPITTAPSP
ncbi:MAG: prepilin-type N-terminal cleavage/methylation domain-containing protein [Oscillospiraceae bacterium]